MYDRMAVRTYRTEVFDWINFVLRSDRREWPDVMHMNEAKSRLTIDRTKVKTARRTNCTVSLDASRSRHGVALICIDMD